MGVSPLPILCSRLPRSSTGRHSPLPDQSLARCLCVSVAISNPVRPLFSSLMSLFHRSLTAPASPLESTLAKVYQNKQLQLPLESTLVKNIGRGRVIVNQPRISTAQCPQCRRLPRPGRGGKSNPARHSPLVTRHFPPVPYLGARGWRVALTRYGSSNSVLSPGFLPLTGRRRAESGLCHLTARLAMSPMISSSCCSLTSPGSGTVSRPVPHTAL